MKKTKTKYLFIILGIIIVVLVTFGGAMVEGYKRNSVQQKAELKATKEQFLKDIKDEENRVANATSDSSLVSAKSQAAIDELQIAVDSAKEVYAKPNPTLNDIIKGSNNLIIALDVYDSSKSTYQPLEITSANTGANTSISDTTVDTTTSGNDEEVWQYCVDRWAYYDTLEGNYSADKYTDDVFNDASANFGISASEAQSVWYEVDKVKTGVAD